MRLPFFRGSAANRELQKRGISAELTSSMLPVDGLWTRGDITLRHDEMVSAVLEQCISLVANNMAALDLQVVNTATGDCNDMDPVAMLWNREWCQQMSAHTGRLITFRRLERYGQCFVVVDRGGDPLGVPQRMAPILHEVRVVIDDVTEPLFPKIMGFQVGQRRLPLLPEEMLWLRYADGQNSWDFMAPGAVASYAIKTDAYAREWQLGEYRNGARPSGILRLGDVEKEVREQIKNEMRSSIVGPSNASKILALSADQAQGAGFDRISMTPAEMSYIESRQENAKEIALGMGVPVDLLFGQSTYDNQRSAKIALWSETILPKLTAVSSEIDHQLIVDPIQTCEFDVSKVEALRESANDQFKRTTEVAFADLVTIDEARDMIGLEPLDGGIGEVTLTAYRQAAGSTAPAPTAWASVVPPPTPPAPPPGTASRLAVRAAAPRSVRVPQNMIDRHHRMAVTRMANYFETQGSAIHDHLVSTHMNFVDTEDTRASAVKETVMAAVADPQWKTRLHALITSTLTSTSTDVGNSISQQIGKAYVPTPAISNYIDSRADFSADTMTATTSDEMSRLVDDAEANGGNTETIAAAVLAYFAASGRGGDRADLFGVAETYPVVNQAGRDAAIASDAVESRVWETAQDDRVDADCEDLQGQMAAIDGAYPSGDEPGEVHIGCRCSETYILAQPLDTPEPPDAPAGTFQELAATSVQHREVHAAAIADAVNRVFDQMAGVVPRRIKKGTDPAFDAAHWLDEFDKELRGPCLNAGVTLDRKTVVEACKTVVEAWPPGSNDVAGWLIAARARMLEVVRGAVGLTAENPTDA